MFVLLFLASLLLVGVASAELTGSNGVCYNNGNPIDFSTLSWSQVTNYIETNTLYDAQNRPYVSMPVECAKGLKREMEWRGKNLSFLPIEWGYHLPSERLYTQVTTKDLVKYQLQLNDKNNMTLTDNQGNTLFNVVSSTDIYQLEDITISREWGYFGTGVGVDIIKSDYDLIQKEDYICIANSYYEKGSGLLYNTGYKDCVYYPQDETYNVNISLLTNKIAIVEYPLPYDPTYANVTDGLTHQYEFNADKVGNDWLNSFDSTYDLDDTADDTSYVNNSNCIGTNGCMALDSGSFNAQLDDQYVTGNPSDRNWTIAVGINTNTSISGWNRFVGGDRIGIRITSGGVFTCQLEQTTGTQFLRTDFPSISTNTDYALFCYADTYNGICSQLSNGTESCTAWNGNPNAQQFWQVGSSGASGVHFSSLYFWNRELNATERDKVYECIINDEPLSETCGKYAGGGGCTENLVNETISNTCYINNSRTIELNEYDSNDCGTHTNTTYFVYSGCDYCVPSATNTSLTFNTTIACLITDLNNDSYYQVEYDSNNCFATTSDANDTFTNVTYVSYIQNATCDFCTPLPVNTSWVTNTSACLVTDTYNSDSYRLEYDFNACYSITGLASDNYTNVTYWDNQTGLSCNYCSISLSYGSWSSYSLTTCGDRNRSVSDSAWGTCCVVTGLASDCYENDNTTNSFTYYQTESLTCEATSSVITTTSPSEPKTWAGVLLVLLATFIVLLGSYGANKGYSLSPRALALISVGINVLIISIVGFSII